MKKDTKIFIIFGVLFVVASMYLYKNFYLKNKNMADVKTIEEEYNIKNLEKKMGEKKPLVIEFSSDSWGACGWMEPIVNELKEDFKDKVNFHKVGLNYYNEKENFELAEKYRVMGVPTFVIYDKDGNLTYNKAGTIDKDKFKEILEALLN